MAVASLSEALEREHREIDDGIEDFVVGLASGEHRSEALSRAVVALRRHIYLEEEFLFPALREAGIVAPILVMLREHGQLWQTLDVLVLELRGECDSATRQVCRQLTAQLLHHNLKEEKILYPQVERALAPEAAAQLRTFLESGQLPDGWVCERAQF